MPLMENMLRLTMETTQQAPVFTNNPVMKTQEIRKSPKKKHEQNF